MAGITDLRPLGIGEILDRALKIVWRNAKTLALVVVCIVLPVQIVSTLITASATPDSLNSSQFSSQSTPVKSGDLAAIVVAVLATALLGFLASTLASGACFRAIASAYLGEQTGWRESLRFALRRLHSIVWISFLAGLAAALGAVLCIIPGIYWGVAFSLGVPVLMSEGLKGRRALGRSRRLVADYWWRVFAVVVLGYVLSGILGSAISGLLVGLTATDVGATSAVAIVVSIIGGTLSKLVTTPFIAAFMTVLYFDLRVRKEGFDLKLLAERIGVDPPADALSGAAPAPPVTPQDKPPFWPPPPGWKPGGDGA